jgi:GDPmannose 4,6-dehydratase
MKRKALILGVSGQDGAYLAQLLLAKGYEVHGSSRDHEASSFGNLAHLGIRSEIALHSIALSDFRSVFSVIDRVRPDEIYNLAGQTSVGLSFSFPVETFESIAVGTLNLLECLRMLRFEVRFYNASSSEVFGNTPAQGAREETPFQPRSPYAAAKAAAHYAVTNYREAYRLYCCSGILFNHESPLRPARFVTKKIVAAAVRIKRGSREKLELGSIDIRRDWGWAPEYVEAMWRMLQQEAPDDYVVATGVSTSLEDFTREVFARLEMDWREFVTLNPELQRPSDIALSFGQPAKARQKLPWQAQVRFPDVAYRLVEAELKQADAR